MFGEHILKIITLGPALKISSNFDFGQTTLLCFEKAMEDKDLSFEVIQRGMYAPNDHILCSDVLHQMTKIYQVFEEPTL
jgi:hypothetical protein